MADVGPKHVYPLRENAFRADAPWDADVLLAPHHPRALPLPKRHLVPVQQRVHAIEQQNVVFRVPPANAAGNHGWANDHRDDMAPPIEHIAAHGQPQVLRNNVMDYYNAAYPALPPPDFVVPYEYHGHDMNNYPGVDQGIPVEAVDPPAPETDIFDYAGQHAPGGLAPAFVDELPHQAHMPVMIEPATEVLRRLASHYLNQPDSQVGMVHMEPGLGGGVRVVITLELADLL